MFTTLSLILVLEMALHTGPDVKTRGETKPTKSVIFSFHGASISDTATTEESQCCSLIRVFPRLHTLFITLLLYNSDIKWHWP